jgi:hypothetical protein
MHNNVYTIFLRLGMTADLVPANGKPHPAIALPYIVESDFWVSFDKHMHLEHHIRNGAQISPIGK